jgi:[ribosomal protein S18]-alanine N-acetyltransferase
MTARIRDAHEDDLPPVVAIERLSFPDPWSSRMFRAHLRDSIYTFVVAEEQNAVVGFAIAQTVAVDSEVLNIAVHPDRRAMGVGTTLLDTLLARCAAQGAESITLEVRESNTAARALYGSHGFSPVGRRRRYYREPDEDGLILRATLPVSTNSPATSP